jgi:hypothetical protein
VTGTLSVAQVAAIIDRKRETHPELARALTWPALLRICEREGVAVRKSVGRMPRMAQLVPYAGAWTIVLNREAPPRRHTYLAAHEVGHLWLHHDPLHDRSERVYNMGEHWPDDPREDDAELFATLLLMGPRGDAHPARAAHDARAEGTTVRAWLVVVAALSACVSPEHPSEVLGTWVHDEVQREVLHEVDTLEFRADGHARSRGTLYSYGTRRSVLGDPLDSTRVYDVTDVVPWQVVRNDDGRHLCVVNAKSGKKTCQPLRVVPETELLWGEQRFVRMQ